MMATVNITLEELNAVEARRYLPETVFLGVMIAIGVIGNCFVLYVYSTKFPPTNHGEFILSLASIDLIACTVCMPLQIADINFPFMFYAVAVCKLMFFLLTITVMAPSVLLVLVAVERYLKICRPFGRQMTLRIARRLALAAILISISMAVPGAIINGSSIIVVDAGHTNFSAVDCWTDDSFKGSPYLIAHYLVFVILVSVCSLSLAVLYSLIGWKLFKNSQKFITKERRADDIKARESNGVLCGNEDVTVTTYTSPIKTPNNKHSNSLTTCHSRWQFEGTLTRSLRARTQKTTPMLFVMTVVSFISFIPPIVVRVVHAFDGGLNASYHVESSVSLQVLYRTFFVSNIANPLIYLICDNKFRKECMNLCYFVFRCAEKEENQQTE